MAPRRGLDPEARAVLLASGIVDTLGGRYITAEDVGTSVDDMGDRRATPHVTGLPPARRLRRPVPVDRARLFPRHLACLEGVFGTEPRRAHRRGRGLGHVGRDLARQLAARGRAAGRRRPRRRRARPGRRRAARRRADEVLFPTATCSRPARWARSSTTRPSRGSAPASSRARPTTSSRRRHGDERLRAGILYAPDYVINAGGIINVSIEVEAGGYSRARATSASAGSATPSGAPRRGRSRGHAPLGAAIALAHRRRRPDGLTLNHPQG